MQVGPVERHCSALDNPNNRRGFLCGDDKHLPPMNEFRDEICILPIFLCVAPSHLTVGPHSNFFHSLWALRFKLASDTRLFWPRENVWWWGEVRVTSWPTSSSFRACQLKRRKEMGRQPQPCVPPAAKMSETSRQKYAFAPCFRIGRPRGSVLLIEQSRFPFFR